MYHLEQYRIARILQDQMELDAERARYAARINRRDRSTSGRRIDLRLKALRPLIAIRQAV